ncbi:hypothetical protein JCM3766R1_004142 [Sporobolomyces carnicolor]
MSGLLRAYNSALIRRPYATGMGSAAFLFGAGDVLAQQGIEKRGKDHDFMRTARLAGYGGLIFAPVVTKWFGALERIKLASKPAQLISRVAADQFVFTPVMVGVFFTSQTFLEGHGVQEAQRRLSDSWWPTLQKNWQLWIPTQAINFALVPPHLRLVTVNVVSLFWNAYLSYANSQAEVKEDKIKELLH